MTAFFLKMRKLVVCVLTCVQKLTVDVCLTRYGDAVAVGIGNQQPLLEFADANAVRPLGTGIQHCAQY